MKSQMKEMHGMGSPKVPGTGASVLMELGVLPCRRVAVFSNPETLQSHTAGGFMETSSHRHDWVLTHFRVPSTPWRIGVRARSSKLLSPHGLVILVTSLHVRAHRKSLHWGKRHSCHPGYSKGCRSLVYDIPITRDVRVRNWDLMKTKY